MVRVSEVDSGAVEAGIALFVADPDVIGALVVFPNGAAVAGFASEGAKENPPAAVGADVAAGPWFCAGAENRLGRVAAPSEKADDDCWDDG